MWDAAQVRWVKVDRCKRAPFTVSCPLAKRTKERKKKTKTKKTSSGGRVSRVQSLRGSPHQLSRLDIYGKKESIIPVTFGADSRLSWSALEWIAGPAAAVAQRTDSCSGVEGEFPLSQLVSSAALLYSFTSCYFIRLRACVRACKSGL